MKKLISLVLGIMLVFVLTVGIVIVVNNNNKVAVSAAPKATATAVPTATTAPQVTEVPAPKATATAVPTVMPMPKSSTMPAIATATSVPQVWNTAVATSTPKNVSSYEISNETIVTAPDGSVRQMMIYASDLSKVGYKEIVINKWNGVVVNCNTKGIVGELYGRENYAAFTKLNAGIRDEGTVKGFFNANGEVFANNVREGYAVAGTQIGVYNLTNVRFVQLTGESCYRMVVVGNKSSGGGNDYPVVTDKPAPTLTPGGDNNEASSTLAPLPDPVATLVPGGSNNDVTSVNASATAKPETIATAKPEPTATAKPEPTATAKATATPEPTQEPSDGLGNGGGNSSLPDPADWLK